MMLVKLFESMYLLGALFMTAYNIGLSGPPDAREPKCHLSRP